MIADNDTIITNAIIKNVYIPFMEGALYIKIEFKFNHDKLIANHVCYPSLPLYLFYLTEQKDIEEKINNSTSPIFAFLMTCLMKFSGAKDFHNIKGRIVRIAIKKNTCIGFGDPINDVWVTDKELNKMITGEIK